MVNKKPARTGLEAKRKKEQRARRRNRAEKAAQEPKICATCGVAFKTDCGDTLCYSCLDKAYVDCPDDIVQ